MPENEALQVRQIMDDLDRFTENAVIEISQEIYTELREGTPVDTGHLKSNWITSIGSFSAVPVGSQDAPSDTAQTAGETRLQSYRLEQGLVYITNSVRYASVVLAVTKIVMAISGAVTRLNLLGPRRR